VDEQGVEWRPYISKRLQPEVLGPAGDWYMAISRGEGECSLDSVAIALHLKRTKTDLKQLRAYVAHDPFIQLNMERTEIEIAESECRLSPEAIWHLASLHNTIPLILQENWKKGESAFGPLACDYLQHHPKRIDDHTNYIVLIWVLTSHFQPLGKVIDLDHGLFQTQFSWEELPLALRNAFVNNCLEAMQAIGDNPCHPQSTQPCATCTKPFVSKEGETQCKAYCEESKKRCQREADTTHSLINDQGELENMYCWYHFKNLIMKQQEPTASIKRRLEMEEKHKPARMFRVNECSATNNYKSEYQKSLRTGEDPMTEDDTLPFLRRYPKSNMQLDGDIWYIWDLFTPHDPDDLNAFVDFLCRRSGVTEMSMDQPISIPTFFNDCETRMYQQFFR